ncbi:MAG: hypothetical protein NTZ90_12395 [Proteobacteria bacterium]|nr:hypothetical protein [Pseudomonadota bacterium]
MVLSRPSRHQRKVEICSLILYSASLSSCGKVGGSSAGLLTDHLVCNASVAEVAKDVADYDAQHSSSETTVPLATSAGLQTTIRQLITTPADGDIWGAALKLTSLGASASDVKVDLVVQNHSGTGATDLPVTISGAAATKSIKGEKITQGATWLLVDFGSIIPVQANANYYLHVTAVAGTNGSDKVLWYTIPGSDLEAYTVDTSTLVASWRSLGRAGVSKVQLCR